MHIYYLFLNKVTILVKLLFILTLLGCGGGGSSQTESLSTSGFSTYHYSEGQPSSINSANSNILLGNNRSLPFDFNGVSYPSLENAHSILNNGYSYPIATRDTLANDSWQKGWTGKDVKVGIIDVFNSNGKIDSHGDLVFLVINSVSPEVDHYSFNLSSGSESQILSSASSANTYFNDNGYHIVNNSWGFDKQYYTDSSWNTVITNAVNEITNLIDNNAESEVSKNFLSVYAAGNGAQSCSSVFVHECDYKAQTVYEIRKKGYSYGKQSIWVGSIKDGQNIITNYSYQAGEMLNDFLVAHDDVLSLGDGAGTSYAAPRVTGAAALLRHKFPNLNAENIKKVLLETASDLGEIGPDRVYGYGLLNISNAMSPQGKVTPR